MTDYILQSPSHLPSSSSSITPTNNDGLHQQTFLNHAPLINTLPVDFYSRNRSQIEQVDSVGVVEAEEGEELSVLAVLLTVLRKSLVGCKNTSGDNCGVEEKKRMEIGWPTNVRHIAHVTFDRFNGFLGLPVEFEPEVPRRPPSASTRVFGVSTESMQLSFDPRGNCVPTILLMMQRRLYLQGGLQSEGIFRINPDNGQEEYVREQLNNGVIPENIDVHCLAGLLKAWFRELPSGILDSLPPEQVMEARSEEECSHLVGLLPPTEGALLDWAINLMADVAQFENFNKMNARNIAMVFAPNMTKMSDPLTALMYAVQVMNFLKTLVVKTLREREECVVEAGPKLQVEPSDEDGHYTTSTTSKTRNQLEANEEDEAEDAKEPLSNQTISSSSQVVSKTRDETAHGFLTSIENILSQGKEDKDNRPADLPHSIGTIKDDGFECVNAAATLRKPQPRSRRAKSSQTGNSNEVKKGSSKHAPRPVVHSDEPAEKKKDISAVSRVNSQKERVEAWR